MTTCIPIGNQHVGLFETASYLGDDQFRDKSWSVEDLTSPGGTNLVSGGPDLIWRDQLWSKQGRSPEKMYVKYNWTPNMTKKTVAQSKNSTASRWSLEATKVPKRRGSIPRLLWFWRSNRRERLSFRDTEPQRLHRVKLEQQNDTT